MKKFSSLYLDTIPVAMRILRAEMRKEAAEYLSVPQFRILANLSHGSSAVNEIAALHGVSQPAMSKMVDCLYQKGLLLREVDENDRRRSELSLSAEGRKLFKKIQRKAYKNFEALASSSGVSYSGLVEALETLKNFTESIEQDY